MWLIYALGGGWGHLTRAVALAKIAQRERQIRVLTNSPYAAIVNRATPSLDLAMLDPCAPADKIRGAVREEIARSRPTHLIVDTFPRGIGGELAGALDKLDARKVLVHRDLNPKYVEAARLCDFVAAHYDVVIVPGAGEGSQLGNLPMARQSDPWLVRSAEEIPDLSEARKVLRLKPGDQSCILICAAGKKGELDWYAAAADAIREQDRRAPVRLIAAERPAACPEECWVQYWPAMDLFGSAAAVVGGAGYNTIQECRAWRVPLIAKPWPRTYDRQERRVERARVTVVQTPEDAAKSALEFSRSGPPGEPGFVNGALAATRQIAAC